MILSLQNQIHKCRCDPCRIFDCQLCQEAKHATLHLGEGPISCVRWRGPLVAWATQKGVKIVDVETQQKVPWLAKLKRDAPTNPWVMDCIQSVGHPAEVGFIPCSEPGSAHLCWLNDEALLIGWDQDRYQGCESLGNLTRNCSLSSFFFQIWKLPLGEWHDPTLALPVELATPPEEVLLVGVRQMSDGVAVRFAKVLRKIPVPGELVKQLAQLVAWIAGLFVFKVGQLVGSIKFSSSKSSKWASCRLVSCRSSFKWWISNGM